MTMNEVCQKCTHWDKHVRFPYDAGRAAKCNMLSTTLHLSEESVKVGVDGADPGNPPAIWTRFNFGCNLFSEDA